MTPAASRALTTRFMDFWLLGGASLLIWLVMFGVQGFRAAWAVDQHYKNLTVTVASLALLVNYPHFLLSYKLAYSRGGDFVRRQWGQLVAVPVGLVALFAVAWAWFETPVSELPLLSGVGSDAGVLGSGRVLAGPRLGDVLFSVGFNVMILTVGWHYTKQVFGCMMVYAHYDDYVLTPRQRLLTKYALLSLWWLNFTHDNATGSAHTFSQFTYYSLDLPDVTVPIAQLIVAAGVALFAYHVGWRNYRERGQIPSLNMLVPFVALYAWWLPVTRQYEFYFLMTPLFHALQYLVFVYKIEHERVRTLDHPEVRGTAIVVLSVVAGWMAFELVPNQLDTALGTFAAWQMFFFFTAATLFINIHHYFIDNALWRFRDPDVRRYLLT